MQASLYAAQMINTKNTPYKNNKEVHFGHIIESYQNPGIKTLIKDSISWRFAQAPDNGIKFINTLQGAIKKYSKNDDVYKSLRDFYLKIFEDNSLIRENRKIINRAKALKSVMGNNFKPQSYLDVGCGNAKITNGLVDAFNIDKKNALGIDIFLYPADNIDFAVKQYDGVNLPVGKNSQDFISLFTVLHHVDNPTQLLKNIKGALSPKGKLVIRDFDAITPEDKRFNLVMDEMLFKVYDDYPEVPIHERYMKKSEMVSMLQGCGLRCEKIVDDTSSDTLKSKNPYNPFYAVFSKNC